MTDYKIPILARGKVIEDYSLTFDGRYGSKFMCPDPVKYLPDILASRPDMQAMYDLSLDDVVDYLVALSDALDFDRNVHLQWALKLAAEFNDNPGHMVEHIYRSFGSGQGNLSRATLEAMIDTAGRENLDGWACAIKPTQRISYVRAMGVPTVHVIAGNGPGIALLTFIRNALLRGFAIIKVPSNEIGAAIAIGRTMIDMAPDHPLSKAFSVAYWRGGDEAFETRLYNPRNVERIVAWGGQASVKHITKYVRPGIDLMTFDPKISRAVLGEGALASEKTMREAAVRMAADIGYGNQVGCASCRVAYVVSDGSAASLDDIRRFGAMVLEEIKALPAFRSSEAKYVDPSFMSQLSSLSMLDDEYEVIGGGKGGGVIISLNGEQVDFADDLKYRHVNIVPLQNYDAIIKYITRDVQTVGVYPESVRDELRLPLALHGVQRITSLGFMLSYDAMTNPHDGNEALRKMATWVLAEDGMTNDAPVLWRERLELMTA